MNENDEKSYKRFVDIDQSDNQKALEGWVKSLDIHNVQARIRQNEVGNYDLTLASKKSSKMRGRQNLPEKKLFEYLNVMYDALHMSQY